MKAGLALNPATPINVIEHLIEYVDMILIMTVNPGFGGQSFIENMYEKIIFLKELLLSMEDMFPIQVDGGVSLNNIQKLL